MRDLMDGIDAAFLGADSERMLERHLRRRGEPPANEDDDLHAGRSPSQGRRRSGESGHRHRGTGWR